MDIPQIVDGLVKKGPFGFFLWIFFLVLGLLFYEQYTDHFKLLRLEKIVNIESKLDNTVPHKLQVNKYIQEELESVISPIQAKPLKWRFMGGILPWLIIFSILMINDQNRRLRLMPQYIFFLFIGMIPAMLPMFFPNFGSCFWVSSFVIMTGFVCLCLSYSSDDLRENKA